jgi:APA family basic amino acid/polyamine antiporter
VSEGVGQRALHRRLGVAGATLMGLGSMVGTGVFVSIGLAAGAAGPAVVLAIAVAALVATCNASSSAQLAASHAVSGGTYEYGYAYLTPALGFTAGWMFLCAKTASAATAALGFAGYLLVGLGRGGEALPVVAVAAVAAVTAVVLTGIRLSHWANAAIVSVTLVALVALVAVGAPAVDAARLAPFFAPADPALHPLRGLLHASALMFVAFTGYGRIATLGEEVVAPRRTIPRAIVATLVVAAVLYVAVGVVAVGVLGPRSLAAAVGQDVAPLEVVARRLATPWLARLVALGAVTAMLGVLLNLVLGLSRVLLAMGRRGDAPRATARLDTTGATPWVAVVVVGVAVGALAAAGTVETAWSFSAFTVLVYYAITNLAALRLPGELRLYPRVWAWGGLGACAFLAFWVEPRIWATGLALLAAGLVWHAVARRRRRR